MKNLRVIFMGTPEFAVPVLSGLNENFTVVGVVCQPDKPSNRGEVKFSPIKDFAIKNSIKIFQPINIKENNSNILEEKPDIIVTCAYGQIIPMDFLSFPKYGSVNVHASLLPKLRGGAPIHRAIIDGYEKTGITIMRMTAKMDAGDIISQKEIPILDTDTAGTLHDKLSILGKDLLLETIPNIINNNITLTKQIEEEVTYAWNIKREDEKIDYMKSSREIINQVRGLNPWPGAYSILNGKIVKIWKAETGNVYPNENYINGQVIALYDNGIGIKTENGEIIITELQLEGRNKMNAKEFINGVVNKDLLIGRVLE